MSASSLRNSQPDMDIDYTAAKYTVFQQVLMTAAMLTVMTMVMMIMTTGVRNMYSLFLLLLLLLLMTDDR